MIKQDKAAESTAEKAEVFTVRDMFASHALSGWLSYGGPDHSDKPALAAAAYEFADAMLAARKT